jgi:hypothetical protein
MIMRPARRGICSDTWVPAAAIAVVKTFDIRHARVPAAGEETRGLVILRRKASTER